MARTSKLLRFSSFATFPAVGGASILYIATDTNLLYRWNGSAYVAVGGGGGGGAVAGVTGLNTDNSDPANPIVQISVDGVTVTGAGTPGNPLVAVGSGSGDVVGPASATDNAIARYDLTTGKIIQNSGITIADGASGTLSGTNTGDQTNISGNSATVTTNANLTGPVTSTGNATAIANGAISNAMLANGAVADLSGTNTGDNATNTQYSGLAASKQDILSEGAFVNGDKTKLNTYSEANQTSNNAKVSYTDAAKVAHITVTQAVNLDTIESDTATNNAKTGITAGQASDITANNAKISFDASSSGKLAGIEALAEVNNISDVNADDLINGSDSTLHFHSSDRDRANATGTQLSSTISDFNSATDSRVDSGMATHVALSDPHAQYQKESEKDATNGYAGLDAGGKINPSQLPSIAITETFVVASQAAMLALTAQTGDVAIRTDLPGTFILQGTDPSVLAGWAAMLTPTDAVTSIFGRSGVVTAQANDYTFAQLASKPTTISGYGISDAETTAQLNARDTANRDRANGTGTQLAATISDFLSAVLTSVLTGISFAASSAITAGDTILSALGKLQAQVSLNNAKITYPSADAIKVGHITATQAVNLDTMESDIATNNAKISYTDAAAVAANTAKITNATHTGEVTGSTALTIANNAVVAAKIADNAVTNAKIAGAGTRDATTFYNGAGAFAVPAGVVEGYTTTATAAGTTVLTVASTRQQFFTGVTTQTVTLPVASTLILGQNFLVRNLSTGIVTVNSSGANVVLAIPSVTTAVFTCILVSGTTAASWSVSSYLNTPSAGAGAMVKLGTATASSSADIGFDNLFNDSIYDHYIITGYFRPATDNVEAQMILRNSTPADVTGTYYNAAVYSVIVDTANTGWYSDAKTNYQLVGFAGVGNVSSGSVEGIQNFRMTLRPHGEDGLQTNSATFYIGYYNGSHYIVTEQGMMRNTTNCKGVRFKFSSGNVAAGRLVLYGVVK